VKVLTVVCVNSVAVVLKKTGDEKFLMKESRKLTM